MNELSSTPFQAIAPFPPRVVAITYELLVDVPLPIEPQQPEYPED